ncbi:MAG: 30S ribosomal protein S13 [Methanobacteriota archaeon]|nr:MAG: 30S ribosomal protein S13 [Euryarchaeota archaeon]
MPEEDSDFRYIVRIANTDLDGNRSVVTALTGIKGIGTRLAEIIVDRAGVPRSEKVGNLPEDKTEEIEILVEEMSENVPPWLLNRKKDYDTGEDLHIIGPDLDMTRSGDINRMRMIRCYKGIRHEQGKKVRGQRTRSNGRSGLTVGVRRKAVRLQQSKKG